MKRALLIIILAALLTSCHSHRKAAEKTPHEAYAPKVERIEEEPATVFPKGKRTDLVKEARKWIGTRYKYGGESRKGVDCSGLVMCVYRDRAGIKLPRNSAQQQEFCTPLKREQLLEADLVFFSSSRKGRVSHVGLYIGEGRFIHSSTSKGVIISSLDEDYYRRHYHSAGRVPGMTAEKASKKKTDEKHSDKGSRDGKRSDSKKDGKGSAPASSTEIPLERLSEILKSGNRDSTSTPASTETSPESVRNDSIRDEVRRAMESFK